MFIGNIFMANSFRKGTEVITTIDARDGGFDSSNSFTSKTLEAGTSKEDLIDSLISDFSRVKKGKVNVDGELRRPVVIDGNTFQLMKKYT